MDMFIHNIHVDITLDVYVVVLYTLMTFVMYRSLYTSALHVVVTDCFLILAFFCHLQFHRYNKVL